MITAYEQFLPALSLRVPDCSANLVSQALWLAGRDFCLETESYIDTLEAIDGVADQKEYTLTVPDQFEALRAFEVRVLSAAEVTAGAKGTKQSNANYDFDIRTNILEFMSAPFSEAVTDGLVVKLVLAPNEDEDDTELDFAWVRRYGEYIKAGALFRLFSMEKTPWYAPSSAALEYSNFRRGVAYAIREVKIQGTTRQLRVAGKGWL